MSDPVERMRKFVEDRQQQVRGETARAAWARRMVEGLPRIEAVVEVVRSALAPEQFAGPAVSVLTDPTRDRFPLVIAFGPLHAEPGEAQAGASAVFRCEPDGNVYGFRYPFHARLKSLAAEPFAELGDPSRIQDDELGHAVAEFLEWATVGGGCGGRKLRFDPPATIPFVAPAVKLSVIAA
jgi:hypothetical protein